MDLAKIFKKQAPTIIDVREDYEFKTGNAENAINIPLGEVEQRIEEFKQMKMPIVVYCRSGNRSGRAMNFLRANGLQEVYNGGSVDEVIALQS